MAMPSPRPTVLVRLSPKQHQLMTELAARMGRSRASLINELVDGAEPFWEALLPSLRAHAATIEGSPVAVRDAVAKVLTGALGEDTLPILEAIQDHAERLEGSADRTAPTVRREDRTAPPSSNTGVSFAGHEPKRGSKPRRSTARHG